MLWRGDIAIEGSPEAVATLDLLGHEVFFVTNNSLLTIDEYVKKLESFGIQPKRDNIITSSIAAASFVEKNTKVFLIGGGGLIEAIEARGADIVDGTGSVELVVVGWDPDINFQKIATAMKAIRSGAKYVATNSDPTYPSPSGLLPGTGSIVAAVRVASGVNPVVAGKPNQPIVDLISPLISPNDVMVGDRVTTDGAFARKLGVHFGLVKTGIDETEVDFDYSNGVTIANDLQSLVELFKAKGKLPDGDFSSK